MSDPTPKKYDETGFTELRGDDSGAGMTIPRSQSDAVLSSSGDSGQANNAPRTYHHSIKERERVNPGNLKSLLSL